MRAIAIKLSPQPQKYNFCVSKCGMGIHERASAFRPTPQEERKLTAS